MKTKKRKYAKKSNHWNRPPSTAALEKYSVHAPENPRQQTEKVVQTILKAIINREGRVNACKRAGIAYDTFLNWMKPSADGKENVFAELIKQKEMELEDSRRHTAIAAIDKAMETQWQAAAWYLERRFPAEFGRRESIPAVNTVQAAIGIKLNFIDSEQIKTRD